MKSTALLVLVLVIYTPQISAQATPSSAGEEGLLTATFVGELAAGEQGHLALRWRGRTPVKVSLWVDFDGDGKRSSEKEQVVKDSLLQPGVEVIELAVPAWSTAVAKAEPRAWVRQGDGELEQLQLTGGWTSEWRDGFNIADLDSDVNDLVVWNDGSGEALYAAGSFLAANGTTVSRVARWDGEAWSPLSGPSGVGVSGTQAYVSRLIVWNDGSGEALYACGWFASAGGVTVNNIARWDGSSWSALSGPSGTGIDDSAHALAVWDDGSGEALYVGGGFTSAGGVAVSCLARWDGTTWSAIPGLSGSTMDPRIYDLMVWDDGSGEALFACGWFTTAGGVAAASIARWNGVSWSALSGPFGDGTNLWVSAMEVWNDGSGEALFACGGFTMAGGVVANRIARWNGTTWSALNGPYGNGTNDSVTELRVGNDGSGEALYAGGGFTTAGGVTVNRVARWNGIAWSALSGPAGTGASDPVAALTFWDDGGGMALWTGGSFKSAGGVKANRIARWSGTAWSALSSPSGNGMNGNVLALEVWDDGSGEALYAGGGFTTAGAVTVNRIARWDGTSWSALGTGMNNIVYALKLWDDGGGEDLYAGGAFTTAGGVAVSHVARWDGTTWSALSGPSGTGTNDQVRALEVWNDGGGEALYAGGELTQAGGVAASHIARWDGSSWSALGEGTNDWVYALEVWDDGGGPSLYAGGWFTEAGGVTTNRVARWDGASWSPLTSVSGNGTGYGTVYAMTTWDDRSGSALYVGGSFVDAGGITVNRVAKWDGSLWSALSGPSGTGMSNYIHTLSVSDDGSGEALYAGGRFNNAGGLPAKSIARWDGTTWSVLEGPLDTGANDWVRTISGWNDGSGPALYAGGNFTFAGGIASAHFGKWSSEYSTAIFADGFESGDTSAWSVTVP